MGALFRKYFCRGSCWVPVTNPTSICEDAGSIPGPTQRIKDLVLLWAVVLVTDAAWILSCCGCDVGWQLQLQLDP